MIPFNHPHDSDEPGLRDYRVHVEGAWDWPPSADAVSRWYRHWLMLALVALLALLAVSVTGCAWNYPPKDGVLHLDAVHPSPERIAELSRVDHVYAQKSAGWLRLSSSFILAGAAIRLTCLVPEHADQRYLRLELLDAVSPIRTMTRATTYAQMLVESVPCGDYAAVCDSLANSNRILNHYEQPFTSRGSCNAGEDK